MPGSFFEKLKKGMGIEITEEEVEKPEEKKPKVRKPKKIEIKEPSVTKKPQISLAEGLNEVKEEKEEIIEERKEEKEKWLESEGELAVDVYQTENELVIQSAIAGVKPEDLSVSIEGDVLTIEGQRRRPFEETGDYFSQECFWGKFARQIILPLEIDPNKIEAALKEGVLTIRMPKIQREKKRKIVIKG